jgi:hypothetical protein
MTCSQRRYTYQPKGRKYLKNISEIGKDSVLQNSLEMERSSKTSVSCHNTIQCHNPEDLDLELANTYLYWSSSTNF